MPNITKESVHQMFCNFPEERREPNDLYRTAVLVRRDRYTGR